MRIGILEDIREVAKIIADHPSTISVFVDGSNLCIESLDIDEIASDLESHGLHLIVNGDNYMVASNISEDLASKAANAGAEAARKAADVISNPAKTVAGKAYEMLTGSEEEEEEKSPEERAKEASKEGAEEAEEFANESASEFIAAVKENPSNRWQEDPNLIKLKKEINKDPSLKDNIMNFLGIESEEE